MYRFLIIHPEGNGWHNPTLSTFVLLLSNQGAQVDILCRKANGINRKVINGLRWIEDNSFTWRAKALVINKLSNQTLSKIISKIEKLRLNAGQYSFLIGVDRQGLIEASNLSEETGIPYGFISFEIMFESETSKRFKTLEMIACKNLKFWVTQDEVRATCLKVENKLNDDNKILIPIGSPPNSNDKNHKTRLRDLINIPINKKVAILMGSLSNWTMAPEIINNLRMWPSDWVLLVHHRYGNAERELDKICQNWRELHNIKLYTSKHAAEDFSEMDHILDGINCGIALYKSIPGHRYLGKNLENIGMASGKISEYLRHGVPVITNRIGIMADNIENNNLGVVITNISHLPNALDGLHTETSAAIKHYYINNIAPDSSLNGLLFQVFDKTLL